jgi:hypothetical protein
MVDFLFITGTYRSSTTLTSRIFNAHPDIQVYSDLTVYSRFHELDNFDFELKEEEIAARILTRRNEKLSLRDNAKQENSVGHWKSILNRLDSRNEKPIVGEKVVLEWQNIPSILSDRSSAVIHTIRDPRSVLVSWKKMTNSPKPRYLDALANCLNSMIYGLLYRKEYSSNRYVQFVYDDFIKAPEEYLSNIQKHLGLDVDLGCLEAGNWTLDGKSYKSSSMHGTIKSNKQAQTRNWSDYITSIEEWIFNEYFPDWILEAYGFEAKRNLPKLDKDSQTELDIILDNPFISESLSSLKNIGFRRFPSDFRDPKTWMKPFFE